MAHNQDVEIRDYIKKKLEALNDVYGNDLVKEVTIDQVDHGEGYPAIEIMIGEMDDVTMTTQDDKRIYRYIARVIVARPKDAEAEAQTKLLKIAGEIYDQLARDFYLNADTPAVQDVLNVKVRMTPGYQDREIGQVQIMDVIITVITHFDVLAS